MSETNIVCPEPSIYQNVPSETYHQWDAASTSRLSKLAKSPMHLKYAIDHPDAGDTPALVFGRAAHVSALQPDLFTSLYVRSPKFDRRTKQGKADAELFEIENCGKEVLSEDDWTACLAIRNAVWNHLAAGPLIKQGCDAELSVVWNHGTLRCKARADLPTKLGCIVDLKTTCNASFDEFEKSIFTYGYYRQAAMYLDGFKAAGRPFDDGFVFVAVEKEPPYAVAVYRICDEVVELGRRENARLLNTYAACLKSGKWPGYSENIQDIRVPAWAEKRLSEQL